jgi:hypothetical protein
MRLPVLTLLIAVALVADSTIMDWLLEHWDMTLAGLIIVIGGTWVSTSTGISTTGTMSVSGASTLTGAVSIGGVTTISAAAVRGLLVSRSGADAGIQISSGGGSGTAYALLSDTAGNGVWQHDADANPQIAMNGAANTIAFAATGGFSFANGRINSNASQPGFLAFNPADDLGVGSGSTIGFDTVVYDNTNNFAAGVFTAQVPGTYLLSSSVRCKPVTEGSVRIVTSNRSYVIGSGVTSSNIAFSGSVFADMDAGDTAFVQVISLGGNCDVYGSGSPYVTFFSGRLVA